MRDTIFGVGIGTFILAVLLGLIILGMWGCPRYNVWQQDLQGQAELARSKQNRQIIIEEAHARLEAEKLNAQSEVERAKGMAQAMEIENGQLTPEYNQYLFIRSLEDLADKGDLPTIIYLPTSGMLPVMDVGNHRTLD